MIHFCTCNGGSASSLELSRKRRVASCKICGGKPLVDGSGSLSGSMVSTVGLELTSVINTEWTWKTISKGNRSTSRRARKSISGSPKGVVDRINKNPSRVEDMPVSESEKLGVTVLGRRFSDKVEHVPIKKRKFCFRSPSSPRNMPSQLPEKPEWLIRKSETASAKAFILNFDSNQHVMAIGSAVSDELDRAAGTDLIADRKDSGEVHEKLDANEDFSGISILAAAACSNSIEGGAGYPEESSMAKDSFLKEREVPQNTESCTVAEELCKEPSLIHAEISNCGGLSCVCPTHEKENALPLEATDYSSKSLARMAADVLDAKDTSFPLSDNLMSAPRSSNRDYGLLRRPEPSSRDDRTHWDLNLCMDSWASPSKDSDVNSLGLPEDCIHTEKRNNLGDFGHLNTSGDIENVVDMSTPMVGPVVSADVHNNNQESVDTMSPVPEIREACEGERRVDTSTPIGKNVILTPIGENVIFSEIGNASNHANLAKEAEPVHNSEIVTSTMEVITPAPVEHTLKPLNMAVAATVPDETGPTQRVDLDAENGEILSPVQVACKESCHDLSCSGVNHITSEPVFEECMGEEALIYVCKHTGDGSVADARCHKTICLGTEVEKHNLAWPGAALSKEGFQDHKEDGRMDSDVLVNDSASEKLLNTDVMTAQAPSNASFDDTMGKSDKLGYSLVSPNTERLTTSGASIAKGEHLFASTAKLQDGKTSLSDSEDWDAIEHDCSMHMDPQDSDDKISIAKGEADCKLSGLIQALVQTQAATGSLISQETCKNYGDDPVDSSGRIMLEEDPYDYSEFDYESDGSHNDPGIFLETAKAGGLQDDYDAQYEDGELRESFAHSWEEGVGDEGEAEHVDYGSDNRDTYGFEAASDYPDSMLEQVEEEAIPVEVHHVGSEGDLAEENNNCYPCTEGSSKVNVVASGSVKTRAAKAVKHQSKENPDGLDDRNKFELSEDSCKMRNGYDNFCARGDIAIELNSQSASSRIKSSGWDQLPETVTSSKYMIMEIKEGSSGKNHPSALIDGLHSMIGVEKRELPLRIEGKTASDAFLRKDRACMQRSRSSNLDDSNSRVERDTGSSKSFGRGALHLHGRGQGGDHRVDTSGRHWGTNCHHSPSYYGPGFLHTGPRNAAAAAAAAAKLESSGLIVASDGTIVKAGSVGPSARVRRQSLNASSQCVHRSLTRKGSPVDREDAFSMHMGSVAEGDGSPERSNAIGRGRSGRYGLRVVGTDSRERYHESVPLDSIGSSFHTLYPLARRERSISPIQRRGAHRLSRSRTRSRSRSRTHSPHLWPAPRGRIGYGPGPGPGLRQYSRTPPNFKSVVRVHRVRSPHHRPGFVVDHIGSFGSTLRSRASPPHNNSRWIDDRKDATDYFRENGYRHRSAVSRRSSPGRLVRRSHKFDLEDPPLRLRADEYHRQMPHGRFPEMGAGRGPRYDGSDDDKRKRGDRCGLVNSVRHHNTDETIKRLRYGLEDSAAGNNSHNKDTSGFHGRGGPKDYLRGIDSGLVDPNRRRGREDKGHFRYGRDEKHSANSKSFEMRECIEDTAPRRRRPS